ncbi:MAG: hypothetical protein AVDCRST_MAG93-2271, partial [uncultured Chloroflexia bacterium]
GVVKVEVSVNDGPWRPATGSATWAFPLQVTEGRYQIRTRATDAVDNVEASAAAMTVYVDATAPTATIAAAAVPALPRRALDNQWEVTLQGSITDPALSGAATPGSGVAPATVEVLLQGQDNGPEGNDWQRATVQGTTWRLPYRFNAGVLDPTGTFTATLRAEDVMGNQTTTSDSSFDVDITGPQVLGSAPLGQLELITDTRTITGTATETGAYGLQDVAVAFRSIEQVVALSGTVLLLPFDERPGSLWHPDGTPNRYDARCADAAVCPQAGEDGRIDQAVRFNNGALAEVPTEDAFDFSGAESFSVQTWLRTATADGTRTLLSKRAPSGQGYALQLRDGSATLVLNDVVVSGGADLRDDRWHHVMAVVDRTTGRATLYVDGVEQGDAAFTGSTANSSALQIGGTSSEPAQAWSGLLDQVLILERALLAEEVPTLVAAANVLWHPATLARRGTAGPETWTVQVPEGLEGAYQIDLRGVDRLGNRAQSANAWRGTIDTTAPRVRITATDTGASYVDTVSNVRMHAIAFTCAAIDRSLSESTFDCPGNAIQPASRSFERNPELEALFPDRVVRDGLTNSYTLWVPATELGATLRACDVFEHCATDSATAVLDAVPDPNAPRAVVVAPTHGRYVAADGTVHVALVATSAQPLRKVELLLGNTVAATLNFDQDDAVTTIQRTVA